MGSFMKHLIEQLMKLGYSIAYTFNPVEQLVYYTVHCGEDLVDMGMADEITLEGQLKEICDECIRCRSEVHS